MNSGSIITCLVCGLDNTYPAPELGNRPANMVRMDADKGVGVCDAAECAFKLKKWDAGDRSFEYRDK